MCAGRFHMSTSEALPLWQGEGRVVHVLHCMEVSKEQRLRLTTKVELPVLKEIF